MKEKKLEAGRFDILVDVPWGKASNRVVRVLDEDGHTKPITSVSHLAPTIFTHPTAYSAPIRVYVSPALYGVSENALQSICTSAEEMYFDRRTVIEEMDIA